MTTSLDGRAAAAAIAVDALTADFGAAPVLRGVDLAVASGEVVALLGPSGCGKTTLLRCIAGLERPTGGSIRIGDVDVTAGRGVPADRRRVGMVFQDGALFPHLDVARNVGYGLARGPARRTIALDALRLVGLADKAERMPGTLSGGEQQRVALARALAPAPSVLLLDEPFSSLDAALRTQLRDQVRELLSEVGVTAVLVTHDQEEAMSFGDRVAVMRDGVVEQVGTPQEVYAAPSSMWVAGFVGEAVLLPAVVDGVVAATALGALRVPGGASGPATLVVRPEQLVARPGGSARVVGVRYHGAASRYEIEADGVTMPLVVRSPGAPVFGVGAAVTVDVVADIVHRLPAD